MQYWLMKSEPDVYSYDKLAKEGKGTWDGVRNFQAQSNLKKMKVGDLSFFYHSNIGKEIVAIMKITKEHFQDPTTKETKWVAVEVEPFQKLDKPVTLAAIKADSRFQHLLLVRQGRLSVMELKKDEFDALLEMGTN